MFGTGIENIGSGAREAGAPTRFRLAGVLVSAVPVAIAVPVAMAVLLAGCGGAAPRRGPSPRARPDRALARQPSGPLARQPSGDPRMGTTQRVDAAGAHLTVTVLKVVDLPSDDDAPVLPGFRGVGVQVEISNTGPADYDSLATSDFSIMATDPNVHLLFVPVGLCRTPPEDFDSHLSAGDHRSGCLAFRIHEQARVTEVRFSPDGQPAGRLSWGR